MRAGLHESISKGCMGTCGVAAASSFIRRPPAFLFRAGSRICIYLNYTYKLALATRPESEQLASTVLLDRKSACCCSQLQRLACTSVALFFQHYTSQIGRIKLSSGYCSAGIRFYRAISCGRMLLLLLSNIYEFMLVGNGPGFPQFNEAFKFDLIFDSQL